MKRILISFLLICLVSFSFQAKSLAYSTDPEKFIEEIVDEAKASFQKRLDQIKWDDYYKSWPFNESALALYNWAPVATELKSIDRKIVLNSMTLKWDNIKEEFSKLIKI